MAEIYDFFEERSRRRSIELAHRDQPDPNIEVFDYTVDPGPERSPRDFHPSAYGRPVVSLVNTLGAAEPEPKKRTLEHIVQDSLHSVLRSDGSSESHGREHPFITGEHRGVSLSESIEKHKKHPVVLEKIGRYGELYTDTLNALLYIDDGGDETQKQVRSLAYTRAALEAHTSFWIEQLYGSLGYNNRPLPAVRNDRSSWLKHMRALTSTTEPTGLQDTHTPEIVATLESMMQNDHEADYARHVQPYRYIGRLTTDAFLHFTSQNDEKFQAIRFVGTDEEYQEALRRNNRGRLIDMARSYATKAADPRGRPIRFEELLQASGYGFPYQADADFLDYEKRLLDQLS